MEKDLPSAFRKVKVYLENVVTKKGNFVHSDSIDPLQLLKSVASPEILLSNHFQQTPLGECRFAEVKRRKTEKIENQITPYKDREERNHRGGKHTYRVNTQSRTFSPICAGNKFQFPVNCNTTEKYLKDVIVLDGVVIGRTVS